MCIHVNVVLVIVHVLYYHVNPNSAMSILRDGMCALEESTIIIIITNHLSNYYFFTYMYVCHHVEMI